MYIQYNYNNIKYIITIDICTYNIITTAFTSGGMVSVFTSSAVDHGFVYRSGHTKDYEIGICCFSAKPTASKRKSKDWLAWKQDNVSEWGYMSIRGLLCQ